MGADAASVAGRIVAGLAAYADAERAEGAARYLKSARPHLGVRVPDVRRTVREALRTDGVADREAVLAVARALWASATYEHRLAAVSVLASATATLTCDDLAVVEDMLRTAETWAIVDPLAIEVAAPVCDGGATGTPCGAVLDRWARDDDFWVRRASLLALMPALRAGRGDWERFGRYADGMLDEREFFLRKAIGWVLRETAKKRPTLVSEWIAARPGRVPVLAVREGVRHLDPSVADPLIAAARRAR